MTTLNKLSILILVLGIYLPAFGQLEAPLKQELDSIELVLKGMKNTSNSIAFKVLTARHFQLEGELERLNVALKSQEKLKLTTMPDAFLENQKTRGDRESMNVNYTEYLEKIESENCCKDISEWNYSYYNISYEEFTGIIIANEEIDFKDIDYTLLQAAIFFETNHQRSLNGLEPLLFNKSLETAANEHAKDMTTYKFFSHTSPVSGKKSVGERAVKAGFNWTCVGENIAQSFGLEYEAGMSVYTPNLNGGYFSYEYKGDPILPHTYLGFAKAVVQQWMDSEGHRENILSSSYTYLGTGCSHYPNTEFYMMDMFNAVQVFGM
jgi:uncharacterized protein YkwD